MPPGAGHVYIELLNDRDPYFENRGTPREGSDLLRAQGKQWGRDLRGPGLRAQTCQAEDRAARNP